MQVQMSLLIRKHTHIFLMCKNYKSRHKILDIIAWYGGGICYIFKVLILFYYLNFM